MKDQNVYDQETYLLFLDAFQKTSQVFTQDLNQINQTFLDYNRSLLQMNLDVANGIQHLEKNANLLVAEANQAAAESIAQAKQKVQKAAKKSNQSLAKANAEMASAPTNHSLYTQLAQTLLHASGLFWENMVNSLNQSYILTQSATTAAIQEIYDTTSPDKAKPTVSKPAKTKKSIK